MNREIDLFGVFVPDLLLCLVVAYGLSVPLRGLLSRLGIDRIVWHRPLFDAALYILLLGGTVAATHRLLS